MATTVDVAFIEAPVLPKSYTEKPIPGSVARIAFFEGINVMEKGRSPPRAGVEMTGLEESEPSAAISHVARKPNEENTYQMRQS